MISSISFLVRIQGQGTALTCRQGFTTRTVTVTTTVSGSQIRSTATQTGTIVLAQAAAGPTSTPSSTNAAAPHATNGAGALVVAALGAFMAL